VPVTRAAIPRVLAALAGLLVLSAVVLVVLDIHTRFAGHRMDRGSAWTARMTEVSEASPNFYDGCHRQAVRRFQLAEAATGVAVVVGMTALGVRSIQPSR
jgi:hypothetical protein